LDRLSCLIKKVQNSFLTYEFHSIYHAIYNFCTIDLSSLYLDILKDRLYCELAADPKRRSSQTALWILAQSLCRMMAPILSVTAEEVFSHLPKSKDDDESVFLNGFPSEHQEYGDDPLHQSFNQFLDIRAEVSKALELARKDKIIGQSLDAKVIFCGSQEVLKTLKPYQDQLPFLWIVSQVEIVDQIQSTENMYQSEDLQGVKIAIQKSPFQKCARCWNYRKEVGTHQKFSDVCDRCVGVLEKINFLPQ
jgi:isoleucyl-tRNA synthetase